MAPPPATAADQELRRNHTAALAGVKRLATSRGACICSDGLQDADDVSQWPQHPDWRVRLGVAAALSRRGAVEAACREEVRGLMTDTSAEVRDLARSTLLGSSTLAEEPLLGYEGRDAQEAGLLRHEDWRVRQGTLQSLLRRAPEASAGLVQMVAAASLTDESASVKSLAGKLLLGMGLTAAPALVEAIQRTGEVKAGRALLLELVDGDVARASCLLGDALQDGSFEDEDDDDFGKEPEEPAETAEPLPLPLPLLEASTSSHDLGLEGVAGEHVTHVGTQTEDLNGVGHRSVSPRRASDASARSLNLNLNLNLTSASARGPPSASAFMPQAPSAERPRGLPPRRAAGQSQGQGQGQGQSIATPIQSRSPVLGMPPGSPSPGLHRSWSPAYGSRPQSPTSALSLTMRSSPSTPKGKEAAACLDVPQLQSASAWQVAADLEAPTDHVRAAALKTLASFPAEHVAPFLDRVVQRLQSDREPRVQVAAAHLLGRLGRVALPVAEALVATLWSTHAVLRQAACTALGRLGALPAVPGLAQLLEDSDPQVQHAAARAMAALGPAAAAAATQQLRHVRRDVRMAAQEAVIRMNLLHSQSQSGTGTANASNSSSNSKSVVTARKTEGEVPAVGTIASASGILEVLTGHIVPVLEDSSSEVRAAAAELLKKLQAQDASPSAAAACCAARLEDLDEEVRRSAVEGLGQMGVQARPHVSKLVRRLTDVAEVVRRAAVEAFERLGPEHGARAAPLIAKLLSQKQSESARRAAYAALGALGEAAQHYELERALALLPDSSASMRCSGIEALQEALEAGSQEGLALSEAEVVAVLRLFLDPHWCVRLGLAKAIRNSGRGSLLWEKGQEALQILAGDKDWRVSREALAAQREAQEELGEATTTS